MAEKDNKPKSTAKPAATTAKPVAKPAATVKPTSTAAKPAAKPAATVKPAAKPAATNATKTTGKTTVIDAKPTAKPAATVKPAAKPTATKPAATTPAAKTDKASKAGAAAPATAPKGAAKPAPSTASKSAAKPAPAPAPAAAKETAAAAATAKPKKAAATTAQPEKAQKKPKEKPAKAERKGGSGKAAAVAVLDNKKIRIIAIAAVALVLVLALILGIVLGIKSCNSSTKQPYISGSTLAETTGSHQNKTQVGYSGEVVGTVDRVKPVSEVKNEGLSAKGYPTYGSTLNLAANEKTTIIQENRKLTANGTWVDASSRTSGSYDKMDENGYLYKLDGTKPGNGVPEQLYKHTGSVGLYGGNVSDDEPAVVKKLTFRPRSYGSYYSVTGLYAPAGEVIKIQMTADDMNATGGITVHIGQALYNGQANNIWEQRNFNRMPVILNTMNITKQTATYDEGTGLWTGYVGSFLGGPIYIRDESSTFSVTISGGVNYAHFILGVTTEAEFNEYKKSSAPYFDLEVWDRGVLHSGPKRAAQSFSYNDLYKAAVLWEKIALVTTSVSNQGIVFLYDPFVAAGAAVAFPGRRSVNCPEGWMAGSLNYNSFVTSGSWGNLHEYHHNFQDYGVSSGANGEVTNNGLNLVSYSLFTKISANRGINSYGGQGLGGWNNYTSAPWVIQQVNAGSITSTNGLAIYATLLHNLGQDAYIKARGATNTNSYLDKWANLTHQDMTYFASKITAYGTGTYTPSSAVKNANYPLFVPVASVYQTGRSYMYDGEKRDIKTMQPYVIPHGDEFTVDLRPYTAPGGQYASGSIVIGSGFSYTIKEVSQPSNGKIVETEVPGVYKYTPGNNSKQLLSGQIRVTLEIYYGEAENNVREYNGHALNDVDLILEFQQSHETNKMTIHRTTYTYDAGKMYTDAVEAYTANFGGYETVVRENQYNPVQNVNTDIWFRPDTPQYRNDYPNDPEKYFIHDNQIDVLDGKLYFATDGKYRVYLRGRDNCAVYFSLDGKTYGLGARITESTPVYDGKTYLFRVNAPQTYFDIEYNEGKVKVTTYQGEESEGKTTEYTIALSATKRYENWLYVKEILIDHKAPNVSFIGLGTKQWDQAMFTVEEAYLKSDKTTTVTSIDDSEYAYTKTTYKNYLGIAVGYTLTDKAGKTEYFKQDNTNITSAEFSKLTESKPIAPTEANYTNAYRSTYEFPDNNAFQTDYFYTRTYTYNYTDHSWQNKTQELLQTNYASGNSWSWANYPAEKLTDGDRNTFIHTNGAASAANPFVFTIDMGEEKSVNRMTMFTQWRGGNGDWLAPKDFKLEGSVDGTEFFLVGEFTNVPRSGSSGTEITVNFEDTVFRYYRLTITRSDRLLMIGEIEMWDIKEINGATLYSPEDAKFSYKGTWKIAQTNSTFGHLYLGKKGSEIAFEYEAKDDNGRFGIFTSNKYGQNFEVYIDGKKVESERLKEFSDECALRYLTPKLAEGKHKVTIKCTGEMNIDAFAIY